MAQEHDFAAEKCGSIIMEHLRANDTQYMQVFSPNISRIGDFDWPRPDYVMIDNESNATYALEYKPPLMSKREYVCGLGQAITYLQHHTYSGLILPQKSDDGFPIADFIKDSLEANEFKGAPISLYAYNSDFSEVDILKPITVQRCDFSPISAESTTKTFWCWWRDMSFSDLFQLLTLSLKYNDYEGDIYSEYIYPEFWRMLITGQCKDFEGNTRNIKDRRTSMLSQKQNYRIPLVQLGLCTNLECRLTELGFTLLSIGIRFGPFSKMFKDALAYLVLVDGKHLDLIHLVDSFQRLSTIPIKQDEYKLGLEQMLSNAGMIGPRKPGRVTTDAKGSYIRDEFKLWNKLDLLNRISKTRYFIPNVGLDFNWKRITEILTNVKL